MSKLPKMYIYTDTFLADTQDLSDTEFGCYCRLLMFHWGKNCQGLPSDLQKLKRITHSTEETLKSVLDEFFYLENDRYFNKKQQKEFIEAIEYANKQSENGRKGAEMRWGYSDPNGDPISDANGDPNGETITTNTNTNTNTISNNNNIYPLSEDKNNSSFINGSAGNKKQRTLTKYSDDFEELWKTLSIENKVRSSKPNSFKSYKSLVKEDQELVLKNWPRYQSEQAKGNGNFAKALERYIRNETFRVSSSDEERIYQPIPEVVNHD